MKRGFTLLEVLIAGGVLFIVSTAVVGLSNSIVQGTSTTNDKTQVSSWAQSGLDLMARYRDYSVAKASGDQAWLPQTAGDPPQYGWYALSSPDCQNWNDPTSLSTTQVDLTTLFGDNPMPGVESMQTCNPGATLTAYRFICIESYAAVDKTSSDKINCNTDAAGNQVSDGARSPVGTDCNSNDSYCLLTKSSLNRSKLTGENSTFIPSGNAVKVRSVIVWQDRSTYKTFDLSTLLTNWKTSGNI